MSNPAITVLMPVYNAERYIGEAIDSILRQTFTDFEFLIINDGSEDCSEEIILSYHDPRIRYVKNEKNEKLITTLNKGISIAKAKYIARMDADDISNPNRLYTQFEFMEQHPEVALSGSWFEMVGHNSGIAKYAETHSEIMIKMLHQCHFCHPSVIMRKEAIDSFETKFDPLFIHAEDYDFFARIGEKFEVANIQEVLVKYRIHEQSISAQNKEMQHQNSLIIKKRLFQNIGAELNNLEIEFYRKMAQHEYSCNEIYLTESKLFLEKLVRSVRHSNFVWKKELLTHISRMWYHVTNNLTPLGYAAFQNYRNSILYNNYDVNFSQRQKLKIKAFFKI